MDSIHRKALSAMTPAQKLRAAVRLRVSAWELKAAWLRKKHPAWTEGEIEAAVRKAFADAARR